jgi:hypothetical protein
VSSKRYVFSRERVLSVYVFSSKYVFSRDLNMCSVENAFLASMCSLVNI